MNLQFIGSQRALKRARPPSGLSVSVDLQFIGSQRALKQVVEHERRHPMQHLQFIGSQRALKLFQSGSDLPEIVIYNSSARREH